MTGMRVVTLARSIARALLVSLAALAGASCQWKQPLWGTNSFGFDVRVTAESPSHAWQEPWPACESRAFGLVGGGLLRLTVARDARELLSLDATQNS
jgi:hypothetical protein